MIRALNTRTRKIVAALALIFGILGVGIVAAPPAQAAYYTTVYNPGTPGHIAGYGVSFDGWYFQPLYSGTSVNGVLYIVAYAGTCVYVEPHGTTYCAGSLNRWISVTWRGFGRAWRT